VIKLLIDIMSKRLVLNVHNGYTNGKVHVYFDKYIPVDVETLVYYGIQRGQVSEGCVITMSRHVYCN